MWCYNRKGPSLCCHFLACCYLNPLLTDGSGVLHRILSDYCNGHAKLYGRRQSFRSMICNNWNTVNSCKFAVPGSWPVFYGIFSAWTGANLPGMYGWAGDLGWGALGSRGPLHTLVRFPPQPPSQLCYSPPPCPLRQPPCLHSPSGSETNWFPPSREALDSCLPVESPYLLLLSLGKSGAPDTEPPIHHNLHFF